MAKEKEIKAQVDPYKEALRNGSIVLSLLGVLTLGEFMIATIAPPWVLILWIVAIWKAFYVVKEYMHIDRVFSNDEEAH